MMLSDETTADNGYKLEIWYDEDAESPLEYEDLANIAFFHRRYDYAHNIGKGFRDPEDYREFVKDTPVIALPLFMLDHSGIAFNTGGFNDPWDSGQVGYVFVTLEQVRKEYSCKRVTAKVRERVLSYLRGFVKELNCYVSGDAYGYSIIDPYGNNIDSCGGFLGYKYAKEEANAAFKFYASKRYNTYLKAVLLDMGIHSATFFYANPNDDGQERRDYNFKNNAPGMRIMERLEALGYKRSPYGNVMHVTMIHPNAWLK